MGTLGPLQVGSRRLEHPKPFVCTNSNTYTTQDIMRLVIPVIFAMICCLVPSEGDASVYDLPKDQQIEKLKPLLLKLLQPKPRPVYQIQQIMKISVKDCCDQGLECCSARMCCDLSIDSCCNQSELTED